MVGVKTLEDHAVEIVEAIDSLALARSTPTMHPSWAPHGAIVMDIPNAIERVLAEARSRLAEAITAALNADRGAVQIERERIVAWLRKYPALDALSAADAIERGDYLRVHLR